MNANQNSRLRRPLTRLHPLLIILAALAAFTLATAPVNAAPRQQIAVNICSRTAEVQTAILALVTPTPPCSAITSMQLAGVTGTMTIKGYSSASIVPGDFAGLTTLTGLEITYSPMLTTVPANAFDSLTALTILALNNSIESLHEDAFNGLTALNFLSSRATGSHRSTKTSSTASRPWHASTSGKTT